MNLILLEPEEISTDGVATIHGIRASHVIDVLQASIGQQLRIGVVDGPLGTAYVESIDPAEVRLRCVLQTDVPVRPGVDLLLALPRPKVLRRLWPQLAALGVGRILLTNAARVERNFFDTHLLDPRICRPLLLEGLQQAKDTRVPMVTVHRQFRPLVEDELGSLSDASQRVVAHPGEARPIHDIVRDGQGRVLLAVGPEGGWNDFEIRLLEQHGFVTATMGERPLRSDTACVALLALVHAAQSRQ